MEYVWSTKNKVGLVMCVVIGLVNVPSVLQHTPKGQVGPPLAILVADTILGIVIVVAAIRAWIGPDLRSARAASIAVVLAALTAVPAFFVPVPAFVKVVVALVVVWSAVAVSLSLSKPEAAVPGQTR
jgi:hypothetical protein